MELHVASFFIKLGQTISPLSLSLRAFDYFFVDLLFVEIVMEHFVEFDYFVALIYAVNQDI